MRLPLVTSPIPGPRRDAAPGDESSLTDTFGRRHNNLRVSVTDRCNLRCVYCMPEDVTFMDRGELLRFEEIADFVRVVAPLGIDKIRLTGGEPLMRRDLPRLVEMLAAIPGIRDIGLTTNGLLLAPQAEALAKAGLKRINLSLDTLDEGRFRLMARRDGLAQTLDGIAAAKAAGMSPVKVNAVIVRGMNEQDVVPLARKALEDGWELRFIEYMPIGAEVWERDKVYFANEMMADIRREIGDLTPIAGDDAAAPASDYRYADKPDSVVGFIASVSRPFCLSCNRLRLTADGKLRNCLFSLDETDVKTLLRRGATPGEIAEAVRACVRDKWEGHEINTARFVKPTRTMHAIGG